LNVLNKPIHAAGLSLLQMFMIYIPLAYFASQRFGIAGIFVALAVSYILAGNVARFAAKRELTNHFALSS